MRGVKAKSWGDKEDVCGSARGDERTSGGREAAEVEETKARLKKERAGSSPDPPPPHPLYSSGCSEQSWCGSREACRPGREG